VRRSRTAFEGAAGACTLGEPPSGWSLFDAYPDPALILALQGRILAANAAAAQITGVAHEALVGSELSAYITDPDLVATLRERALAEGSVRGILSALRHPSGTVRDMMCSANVYRDPDGRVAGLLVGLHDVGHARQTDRRLAMLAAANQALVRAEQERTLLQEICEITATVGGYQLSWVGACVPEGTDMALLAQAGPSVRYLKRVHIQWDGGPLGQGPSGRAVRTGVPQVTRDIQQDPTMAPWRDEASKYGLRSSLAVPFAVDGQTMVFHAYAGRPDAFDGAEAATLQQLGGNLAVGLSALRLQQERERTEHALRRSRALLADVERMAHVGGWEYDAATGAGTWTDEAYRIHGLDPGSAAVSPEASLGYYSPGDRERVADAFARAAGEGEPYDLELRLTGADGRPRWIRTMGRAERRDGQIVRVYGNVMDITERHRQQQALRESAEQFRTLFEESPVGVAYVALDGTLVRVNRRLGEITGYGPDLGHLTFQQITYPDDVQASLDVQRRLLDGDGDSYSMEKRYVRKDGSVVWVDMFATLVRDERGCPAHFVSVMQDIDDRKRAQDELRVRTTELTISNEQLRVTNRELESFTYTVSHNLRGPLRHITGFTRLLLENYGPVIDTEGRRMLDVVDSSARRLGHLVDDLLAFSRIGRHQPADDAVDMTVLARRIAAGLCAQEPGRDIRIDVGDLPPASGDASLLTQVWTNLLANAVKFTAAREHAVITVTGGTEQSQATYRVTDNGIGFDMAHADKLFGIFQQLHPRENYPGTGVGLAIVARIVARHGGHVAATSAPGTGATFAFSLPLAEEDSP